MKKILLLLVVLSSLIGPSAFASDKDVLRDACSAIKISAKRSECFDSLERLVAAQPMTASSKATKSNGALKVNFRALTDCAQLEFAEMDSMSEDELLGLYCTYDVAKQISENVTKTSMEKQSDPRIKAALLSRSIQRLQACSRGQSKAGEILARKFPNGPLDCSRMPKPSAAPTDSTS